MWYVKNDKHIEWMKYNDRALLFMSYKLELECQLSRVFVSQNFEVK